MENKTHKNKKERGLDELAQVHSRLKQLEHKLKKMIEGEKEISSELEEIITASDEIIVDDHINNKQRIKNKIKVNKKYLDQIIRDCKEGVFVITQEGNIQETNGKTETLLGYKKEVFKDMEMKSIFPLAYRLGTYTEHADAFSDHINAISNRKRKKNNFIAMETTLVDKKKSPMQFQIKTTFLKDSTGQLMGAVLLMKNIRERKGLEHEIRKEKEHLKELLKTSKEREIIERLSKDLEYNRNYIESIIESSADGIIITDTSGYIKRVNEAFAELLDYPPHELVGKHWAELVPREIKEYYTSYGEKILLSESHVNDLLEKQSSIFTKGKAYFECYLIRRDGTLVPIECGLYWIYDKKGEWDEGFALIRDITEKKLDEMKIKQAYNELQEAKEYLENVFSTSADGIIIVNPEGTITRVNESVERMTGYNQEELIEMRIAQLSNHDDDAHFQTSGNTTEKIYEEGSVTKWEAIWQKKDGSMISTELNSALLKDKKGEIIGGVTSVRDITERKEMEKILIQSEKLKSLGELAGGVAHDFNNILAAVLGRVELLKMKIDPTSSKQKKGESLLYLKAGLEIIERASLDGAETVRRIQEFSRKRADDRDFTQVDINGLIDNALDFTRVKWKGGAALKGIEIRIQKEFSPLPPVTGSPSELREVFTNLINNAVDAMPQGGDISVKTFMDNNLAAIKIADTGNGIPEDIKDRIFDSFFTTKDAQSTGLGLSVSYGIVNRHHGTIKADSVEEKGTTFTIKLPITKKTDTYEAKGEKVIPIKKKQKKIRILVIENEEDVRQILSDILTDGGHEVEAVADGSQGIEAFEKKEFDLVFTDLGMSGLSGWQVAEKIKSINEKVPVAIITGWKVELDGAKMNDNGVDLFIQKPFKMGQVLNLVQEGMILRERFEAE